MIHQETFTKGSQTRISHNRVVINKTEYHIIVLSFELCRRFVSNNATKNDNAFQPLVNLYFLFKYGNKYGGFIYFLKKGD